jgi:hypothetical protein
LSPTPLPPDPRRSREELLGIVRSRAGVLRRRRRAAIGGTLALALAVLGGGIAVSRGLATGPSVRVTAGQGEDQPAPDSSTTTATSAAPTTISSPTTTTTARAKSGPSTSTTTGRPFVTGTTEPTTSSTTPSADPPACRNSTDSRCGPFRWEPEPTKHPLAVDVSVLTADPVAGKPVQFNVIVDEKDTNIARSCYGYSGTGIEGRPPCMPTYPSCVDQPTAYGPWSPPEQMPDRFEMTESFTYDKPGTYTLSYTFNTGWPGCYPWSPRDPYANTGTGSVTFTVRAPAEGETSTTTSTSTTTTRPSGRNPG